MRSVYCMEIPQDVRSVLFAIQSIDKSAVIAGGYLRDLYLDRPIKDLDIVVDYDTNVSDIIEAFKVVEGSIDQVTVESSSQDTNFSRETSFQVEAFPYPINITNCRQGDTPIEKTKHNDFGICQIWYDGADIDCTDDFQIDASRAMLTIRRCNSYQEFAAIMQHYYRIRQKYDWPLVIPTHFVDIALPKSNFVAPSI